MSEPFAMDALFPHDATTRNVTVRVAATFLPEQSDETRARWFWSYHIRIENHGGTSVQLLHRTWLITDGRGMVNRVEGEGVVGEQPLIAPGRSYDYVSGCPLTTPNGAMVGHFTMVDEHGTLFDAAIPRFALTPDTAVQ